MGGGMQKSCYSQLQLQSFNTEGTTREIVTSVPPVKRLQSLYNNGAPEGITDLSVRGIYLI